MVTTWELAGIRSINPSTMRVRIDEFIDGVFFAHHNKDFSKTLTQLEVLVQFALFVKQKRDQSIADRVPFNNLNLSNFENRIQNS